MGNQLDTWCAKWKSE